MSFCAKVTLFVVDIGFLLNFIMLSFDLIFKAFKFTTVAIFSFNYSIVHSISHLDQNMFLMSHSNLEHMLAEISIHL